MPSLSVSFQSLLHNSLRPGDVRDKYFAHSRRARICPRHCASGPNVWQLQCSGAVKLLFRDHDGGIHSPHLGFSHAAADKQVIPAHVQVPCPRVPFFPLPFVKRAPTADCTGKAGASMLLQFCAGIDGDHVLSGAHPAVSHVIDAPAKAAPRFDYHAAG
jgi:hypothetical protein